MGKIHLKRAYERPSSADGLRVLVDRLWPRGLSKNEAAIDVWVKEVAPSTALRWWYDHDPEKWSEFKQRYFLELEANPAAVEALLDYVAKGDVTLLFGSRELCLNNAVALKEFLELRFNR
jgi:uncharacterized protein YeaO (DUF488 family)